VSHIGKADLRTNRNLQKFYIRGINIGTKLVQYTGGNTASSEDRLRLPRTVLSLSAIAVCTKVFGFVEKLVIAHFFGTHDTADVYFASMGIVLSIVWLVRELMYPSLLPVFADSLSKSALESGNLFRKAFLSTMVFLAIVAVILVIFSEFVIGVLVPGFSESKREISSKLLRMLAPGVFFLGLTMVTYTTLNARKRFLKAACPEAALKLFIVVGLVVLLSVLGIYALAVVMVLGSLGCLLVQLYFIPERRFLFKQDGNMGDGDHFRKVLLLMGPLVVGVVFSHISGLVDNLLASTLPSGHLSFLGYSKKLIDAILLIGPVALVTVVYSQLSHLASAKDYKKFTSLVIKAFRLLVYLSVPVACLLIGLKQPLIRFLFQRGQFDADSTLGTSQAFMVYAFGLVTFSLETLLVHSFFALSDTKTPVKFGVLCVFLDIGLAILLLKPFGYLGIAGAFVVSKTVKITILATILNRRLEGLFDLRILGFSAKLSFTTVTVWVVMRLLLGISNPDSFSQTAIFDLMLPGVGALSVFILCSYFLRIDEFRAVVSLLRYRKAAVDTFYEETK
jgi:putative peptidoglycan lipid II flippase